MNLENYFEGPDEEIVRPKKWEGNTGVEAGISTMRQLLASGEAYMTNPEIDEKGKILCRVLKKGTDELLALLEPEELDGRDEWGELKK